MIKFWEMYRKFTIMETEDGTERRNEQSVPELS